MHCFDVERADGFVEGLDDLAVDRVGFNTVSRTRIEGREGSAESVAGCL